MNEEEINKLLAAFFHSGTRVCQAVEFGGGVMGWSAFDDTTYDGEGLGIFETPLEAIQEWHDQAMRDNPSRRLSPKQHAKLFDDLPEGFWKSRRRQAKDQA